MASDTDATSQIDSPTPLFTWFQVLVTATLLHVTFAGPIWYFVYIRKWTAEEISTSVATWLVGLPAWPLLAMGLMLVAVFGMLGPIYALWKHHDELERRGNSPSLAWLLCGFLGVQFWPLTVLAVAMHYRSRRASQPVDPLSGGDAGGD